MLRYYKKPENMLRDALLMLLPIIRKDGIKVTKNQNSRLETKYSSPLLTSITYLDQRK